MPNDHAASDASTPSVRVRDATLADMDAVVRIYNDAVLKTTATYDYEPRALAQQHAAYEEKRRDGYPMFVAVDDGGTIVGFSTYGLFRGRPGWRFTVEHSVYVDEAARGRGVGGALLTPLVAHAREHGFHSMVGVVDAANLASISLHEKHGFTLAGTVRQGGYKFERWLDVAFMQKMLGPA